VLVVVLGVLVGAVLGWRVSLWPRCGIDRLAVSMPGGVTDQWQYRDEANEHRGKSRQDRYHDGGDQVVPSKAQPCQWRREIQWATRRHER